MTRGDLAMDGEEELKVEDLSGEREVVLTMDVDGYQGYALERKEGMV